MDARCGGSRCSGGRLRELELPPAGRHVQQPSPCGKTAEPPSVPQWRAGWLATASCWVTWSVPVLWRGKTRKGSVCLHSVDSLGEALLLDALRVPATPIQQRLYLPSIDSNSRHARKQGAQTAFTSPHPRLCSVALECLFFHQHVRWKCLLLRRLCRLAAAGPSRRAGPACSPSAAWPLAAQAGLTLLKTVLRRLCGAR